MLLIPTFATFEDAYLGVLEHVSTGYEHVNAPRGNTARECLNVSFAVAEPRERIVYHPARRTNIVFCFAEALWCLWGRDDLDMIGYYAPRLREFSTDGHTLAGTAHGRRLFRTSLGESSQWQHAVDQLTREEATKRAVMTVFSEVELEEVGHPDVSCTIAVQFLLRDQRLHAVVYMRGNDAYTGLACDVFSFSLIQEFTARQLGVQLGRYAHHVGSMHINDTDADRVKHLLAGRDQPRPQFPIHPMPATSWADLKLIEYLEHRLRRDHDRISPHELDRLELDPYWRQVVLLLEIYRQIVHHPDIPVEAESLHVLFPAYRSLIVNRWPERMPAGFTIPAGRRQ